MNRDALRVPFCCLNYSILDYDLANVEDDVEARAYIIADEREDTDNHFITNPCKLIGQFLIHPSNSKRVMNISKRIINTPRSSFR